MGWITATALFLQISVQMGTPILFGTLGGILGEKTGNLNLGVEGMMIMGAAVGFKVALVTANPWLAVLAAGIAGALGALIYCIVTVTFKGNQTVTGLALTIFGTGFAGMLGKSMSGVSLPQPVLDTFAAYDVPGLSKIPILGEAFFQQSIYVQIAPILAVLIYFFIKKTRIGLNMRAVGENPAAADASGINVNRYKYLSLLAGGFLCGVGGAYLSLVFVPSWQDNITNGLGWIAVALVIFST
ncbi:MAG: ABC transporter permease, partial [Christensenellales bacterium]